MSSAKLRPFHLGLNVFISQTYLPGACGLTHPFEDDHFPGANELTYPMTFDDVNNTLDEFIPIHRTFIIQQFRFMIFQDRCIQGGRWTLFHMGAQKDSGRRKISNGQYLEKSWISHDIWWLLLWLQYWYPPIHCNWFGGQLIVKLLLRVSHLQKRRRAAYMHQWIGSAMVQIMDCRLFGAKPLSKPMLGYCQLDT